MHSNIYGINAVRSRLRLGDAGIERLLLRNGSLSDRLQIVLQLAEEVGCPVTRVDEQELDAMTSVVHQGVGLVVARPEAISEDLLYDIVEREKDDVLLLVLDGITDPRNLGACLRSAATLGVHAVIVPKDNSAPLTDAAIKTASGGASYVPLIQVVNLARCLRKLKQQAVWIVGTLLDGDKPINQVDLKGRIALVMGSEEKGIRRNTTKCCDFLVKIPMVNSELGFNVSVAAGICLYEANRQRQA